ncbi:Hypothetical predicted protein [Mytilus galloprovincialis]|uniref:C-type lectin domain-containing protein n=1 Tax=Mytilus galloprovincialis TaxID=29158 RepID=A0A8B6EMC3_MYTGA|nr:Hypothetical predicted protein [Mytilus galloprovincialis]
MTRKRNERNTQTERMKNEAKTKTGKLEWFSSCCTYIPVLRKNLYAMQVESCKCLGGKLVELETEEENEFIKNDVMTISSGVAGYWIGGYNFNNDDDLEWLSQPNQAMPFSDWNMEIYPQPDGLLTQPCVMIWRGFDFRWGDHWCDRLLSYICEFQHQ